MHISVYTDEEGRNVYLSGSTLFTGDEAFRKYIVEERGFSEAVADYHIAIINKERRILNPNLSKKAAVLPSSVASETKAAPKRKKTTKPRKAK